MDPSRLGLITVPSVNEHFRGQRIRSRTRALLREMKVGPDLTVDSLIALVSQRIGLPIETEGASLPVPGFCGVTLVDDVGYVIYFQSESSVPHRTHHIVHELGHIICGSVDRWEEHTSSVARSHGYGAVDEYDAELVATVILQWANVVRVTAAPAQTRAVGARLAPALEEHIRSA